jgi:4-hydroxy-tetrahydrodipicolinate synthase
MKISPVTSEDFRRSVISVPPLARNRDYSLNRSENERLARYIEDGGVSTLLYGGNANLYNIGLREFPTLMEMIESIAGSETWVIPSIGPDFGKALDQVGVLGGFQFPTALLLPIAFPSTPDGVEQGVRHIAQAYGRPLILYIKTDRYIAAAELGKLFADKHVCGIKYAVPRKDLAKDEYLSEILQYVDRGFVVSGFGERPAISHMREFDLAGFTSGSVCLAPHLSGLVLKCLQERDYVGASRWRELFMPLEDLRDTISPLRVLHDAVTHSGIANMGPQYPLLSNISDPVLLGRIGLAAKNLLVAENANRSRSDQIRATA